MRSPKNIKMADIARKLNVSIVSVSKALSGKEGVSDQTRKKILAMAKEMGYMKHSTDVLQGEADTVIVMVAQRFFGDSSFYSQMYNSLLQNLNGEGYTTVLEIVSQVREQNNYMPPSLGKKNVVGIIFMGEMARPYINEVAKTGIPYMFLDFYDSNYCVNSVSSDSMKGAYLMTKHLIEQNLTDITFVGSIDMTSSIMDRYLGYVRAMTLSGLSDKIKWLPDRNTETGKFIKVPLPESLPQAFFCNNDSIAFLLIQQLHDRNISVPEDISVLGFDDSNISRISNPTISTYQVDIPSMTQISVDVLKTMLKHKDVVYKQISVPGKVLYRESSK